MQKSSSLIIVMPVYNEEGCIKKVVEDWTKLLVKEFPNDQSHICAVNDGSKDSSGKILDEIAKTNKRLRVIHQRNGGHGNALLNAYKSAIILQPDYILHIDSDDQVFTSDFEMIWQKRSESMLVLGYRKIRDDDFLRLIITRILRVFLFTVYQTRIKDSNIPFRLINTKFLKCVLKEIPNNIFAPNILISVLAKKLKQNLQELPIKHKDRETGNVSIVRFGLLKVCIISLTEFINFRIGLSRKLKNIKNAI
jgi:glycosyltransferase involved in cell wall biosynthesis